jgi:hypothetical protein
VKPEIGTLGLDGYQHVKDSPWRAIALADRLNLLNQWFSLWSGSVGRFGVRLSRF